jgi:tRNA(Arg) A34 adenosine deaminase TadA
MHIKDMVELAMLFTLRGSRHRDFYLGAIGERRDGAIVFARNETDTRKNPLIHAERRLVSKLGMDAKLVIVVRVSKGNGQLTMAKPCPDCEKALRLKKPRKVYYTSFDGTLDRLW